jgi:integrase
MDALRQQQGVAANALAFLILTATRASETLNMTWTEVDLAARVWTIPSNRMKANKEFRVPLSDAAVGILEHMRTVRQNDYVFPGWRDGRPLSQNSLLILLRKMKCDAVSHGFRSSFRDFCAEQTNFPNEVAEMSLAHTIPGSVERAYRRGDLIEKRTALMSAWAKYCTSSPNAKVVPLGRRK